MEIEMRYRKISIFLAPVALLFVLACSLSDIPQLNLNPSGKPSGRIVYVSNESGNWEIYLMDLATKKSTRLTNNSAEDYSPAYIPALNKIGFVSDRGDGVNVYTMNLDGSEQKALFEGESNP
jgi:TolB protein